MINFKKYCRVISREIKIRNNERRNFMATAINRLKNSELSDTFSLQEYEKALFKHRFTIDEYLRYKLESLPEEQRNDVISCCEMNSIYRKFVNDKVRKVFANKTLCLKIFDKWVNRKWFLAREISLSSFIEFLSSTDVVVKPTNGECGQGVFIIHKNDNNDYSSLYNQCVQNNMLIEERIYACNIIEQFHPASLNTIRIVTMSNGKDCIIIGAALRMGASGSVIDNISAGGLSVPIDIETGIIQHNGYDSKGNEYEYHPDTKIAFNGTLIPHWQKVIDVCKESSLIVQDAVFTGWDICILPSGEIELIEANAMPDIGVIQYVPGFEKKNIIKKAGKKLLHKNLLKLTSVYSWSYR